MNKTIHLLIKNELKKLKSFDLGYFIGKSHLDEGGAQNYLVFHPILECFRLNSSWITKSKSKGLSNESLEVVSKTNSSLTPPINYYGDKARLKLTGSVLQQKTVRCSHKEVVNFYIVCEINQVSRYRQLSNIDKCIIWSC